MNQNYASAAQGIPCQALAIRLCELVGLPLDNVTDVDIHCPSEEYPVVTFTCVLRPAQVLALAGYESRPAEEKETP